MGGKQAVHKPYVVSEEEPKPKADYTRSQSEAMVDHCGLLAGVHERQRDRARDEPHPGDGSDSKDEEVSNRPFLVMDGRQDQEGDGGGPAEAMYHTHDQRPKDLIETDGAEMTSEPTHCTVLFVWVSFQVMSARMRMDVTAVAVWMRLKFSLWLVHRRRDLAGPLQDAREIHDT